MPVTEQDINDADDEMVRARDRVDELRDLYFRETALPKMRKLVGRCFRYRNAYGGGEPWWLYVRIAGVNVEGRRFQAIEVQRDCNGKISIGADTYGVYSDDDANPLGVSYQLMTPAEYRDAVRPLLAEVARLTEVEATR